MEKILAALFFIVLMGAWNILKYFIDENDKGRF